MQPHCGCFTSQLMVTQTWPYRISEPDGPGVGLWCVPASCTFGPYRFVGESSETPAARSQQDTVLRPHPSSIPRMIVKKYFWLLRSRTLVRISHHSAVIAGSVHAAIGCSFGARNVPGKTILTEDPRGCADQFPPTAVQLILLQRCPKVQPGMTTRWRIVAGQIL